LGGKARRDLGVARRSNLSSTVDYDWQSVVEFHRMHVELRRSKYQMLAQPLGLFEALWNRFPTEDRCIVNVRTADNEAIASAVLFRWCDVVYFKFSASNQATLSMRPNHLLYRSVIAHACDTGARLVDWGLSDNDQPGLLHFKGQWSTAERALTTYRCGSPAASAADVGRMLGAITGLLTDPSIPTDVVTRAGEQFYKYFA
jgi:CelD/BcsL family acetyltransferase involved in cellulose biosynthesis